MPCLELSSQKKTNLMITFIIINAVDMKKENLLFKTIFIKYVVFSFIN